MEVMVAIAILGLALTAIFSSQVGAMAVGLRARKTDVATLLARCKMAEIEEQIHDEGLPAVLEEDTDECCEGGEIDGYTCDYKIERVVLPDAVELEEGVPGMPGTGSEEGGADDTAIGTSVDELLAGGGTDDAVASLALTYAFPLLKPSIEEQVRRATVTVKWKEGTAERSFDVVQFLVATPTPAEGTPVP